MEIRTLEGGEREALLDLLDGWPLPDGASGREFFRRYLERDPTFADENVWVAAEGSELLSCVQIFPRPLRVAGAVVPAGGIGSVFTRADARRRGLAERLVERACAAMGARGMVLSLLFGVQPLYARQGFELWPARAALLVRAAGAPAPPEPAGVAVAAFDRSRDGPELRSLHARYSEPLAGSVARDDALWEHSLANAGNPDEEFLVARAGGALVAYARAALLSGVLALTEFACEPGCEPALVALVSRIAREREGDPFAARAGRPTGELRRVLASAPLQRFAPGLAAALAGAGFEVRDVPVRNVMLRCLDAGELGRRVGAAPRAGEAPNAFLARLLPGAELAFWTADRF